MSFHTLLYQNVIDNVQKTTLAQQIYYIYITYLMRMMRMNMSPQIKRND